MLQSSLLPSYHVQLFLFSNVKEYSNDLRIYKMLENINKSALTYPTLKKTKYSMLLLYPAIRKVSNYYAKRYN
jgi:hypothetical protein